MTTKNGNEVRAKYTEKITNLLSDEDVMQIATGSVTFPVVAADGEEGWVEIVIKVPKWTDDDDGYAKAEAYQMGLEEKKIKAAEKEAEKQKKIAAQQAKKKKKNESVQEKEEES